MFELVQDESKGDPEEGPSNEEEWLEIPRQLSRMIRIIFRIPGSTYYSIRNKSIRKDGANSTQYGIDSPKQVSQTLLKRLKMA